MRFSATSGGIDFETIRRTVSLRRLVEDDLGPPMKGGRWKCPLHGGEGPNFAVHEGRWKCWTHCGSGDVLDYLARRENISVAEAARRLDPSGVFRGVDPRPPVKTAAVNRPADKPAAWHDPDWQEVVEGLVSNAESNLWGPGGREALAWLRARGLDPSTIRRFRLGFLPGPFRSKPLEVLGPDRRGETRRVWAGRGVVIPWDHPSADLVGANVRNLPAGDLGGPLTGDKYTAIAGSERGHGYPFPDCAAPGEPALICEGEFDALVGWQEAGWLANVVTFGGAGQSCDREDAKAFLASCPDWLLMYDQDKAGDDAARVMARRSPHRCRRLYLPAGVNDLTDLHKSGGPVLGWLRSEWERFGWPWPLRS
jgi:DNA primase